MKPRPAPVTGVYRIEGGSSHAELWQWLRAHGIEPQLVPNHGATAVVGAGRVTIDVYLTRDGQKYRRLDGAEGNTARGKLQVPLDEGLPLPRCFKIMHHKNLINNGGVRA